MSPVNIVFTSDHQKVLQGLAKSNAALEKQVATLRKVDRAGKRASKSVKGIGDSAFSSVAGFVSLGAAVAKVNQALEQQVALRRGAAERIEGQEENLKRLIQISGGDRAKFEAFRQTAAGLVQQQGFTADQATGLVFQGASLGFTNQQILQMGKFKRFAKDIGPLFSGIAGIQKVFGEEALGGTPESVISAALAGAEASKVSVEQLLAEVLKPGKSIRRLGGTAAETLAATAVATITTKSPELAATEVARLADVLGTKPQFKGRPFAESLQELAGLSVPEQEKMIGKNLRAQRGVDALVNNLELFNEILARVTSEAIAGPESLAQRSQRLSQDVGITSALTAKQRAREASKLTVEQISGPRQLRRETVTAVVEQVMEEFKLGPIDRAVIRTRVGLRAKLDLPPIPSFRPQEAFPFTPSAASFKQGEEMTRRFLELLRNLGLAVDKDTGELRNISENQDETNEILRQILDKEPGVGGPLMPARQRVGTGTGPPYTPPVGPGPFEGIDPLEAWAAANELMNLQGWTDEEKFQAWRRFRRKHVPGLGPKDRPEGGWMPGPSDESELADVDRQTLRDMVRGLGLVVDDLTNTLKRLNEAAAGTATAVASEPQG